MAGAWEKGEIAYIIHYFANVQKHTENINIDIDTLVDSALGKDDPIYTTIDEFHLANYNLFYEWLESLSLNCPTDKLQELKQIMKEEGFLKVFDYDVDMIYLLAYISLLCSNSCNHLKLFDIVPFELYSLDKLKELSETLKRFGFSNIELNADHICTRGC